VMLETAAPVNHEIQAITGELVTLIDHKGWCVDPEIRKTQFELADTADQAYLDRDFDVLRNAARRLKKLLMAQPERADRSDEQSSLWCPVPVSSIAWGRGYEQRIAMLEAENQAKNPGKRGKILLESYCEYFWHIPSVRVENAQITREEEKRKNNHLRLDEKSSTIICTDEKCGGCWACDSSIWPVFGEYELCLERLRMELEAKRNPPKPNKLRKAKPRQRGDDTNAQAL
jgi:hypothetical protein